MNHGVVYAWLRPFFSILLVITLLMSFSACDPSPKSVSPAFYHWQTDFRLSSNEIQYLHDLAVKKLYVKFFDVDWDFSKRMPQPTALINPLSEEHLSFEIIPTVFITNRTLLNIPPAEIENFANQVAQKIMQKAGNHFIREVQMDCDWTGKTRTPYFRFLEALKTSLPPNTQLSATIRLHQLKYIDQTGVPPIDKGVLMVYNVGDLESWRSYNSILTNDLVASYLRPFGQYPVHLDLALPIFAWGVVYRNNEMIKLINNLRAEDLQDADRFVKLTENRFRIRKSHYIKGYYLYEGDQIRTESVPKNTLDSVAQTLAPFLTQDSLITVFYHLDTTTIKHYPHEDLQAILQQLAK